MRSQMNKVTSVDAQYALGSRCGSGAVSRSPSPMKTGTRSAAASVLMYPGDSIATTQLGIDLLPKAGAVSRSGYPPAVSAATTSAGTSS
jgi:hypothetical protein